MSKKISCNDIRKMIKESVIGPNELLRPGKQPPIKSKRNQRLNRKTLRGLIKEELNELETSRSFRGPGASTVPDGVLDEVISDIGEAFSAGNLKYFKDNPSDFADPKPPKGKDGYGPWTAERGGTEAAKRAESFWEDQVANAVQHLEQQLSDTLFKILEEVEEALHTGDFNRANPHEDD